MSIHIKRDGAVVCKPRTFKRGGRTFRVNLPKNVISLTDMHKVRSDKLLLICKDCLKWYYDKCKKETIIV